MSTMFKRMLSLAVALVMIVSLIPLSATTAHAAEAETGWHDVVGAGTAENPYIIDSKEDLLGLVELSSSNSFSGEYIQLGADIDLSGIAWEPIGQHGSNTKAQVFKGTFDGNGHTIKNLTNTLTSANAYYGLFGKVSGTIKNLNIDNFKIEGTTGYNGHCGAVAGMLYERGSLENVHVTASIKVSARYVGGLVGGIEKDGGIFTITNCSFSGSVQGNKEVGGLVGYVKIGTNLTIANCTNNGTVTATQTSTSSASYTAGGVGGLIGHLQKATATITNSHNNGAVSGVENDELQGTIIGGVSGNSSNISYVKLCNVTNKNTDVEDLPLYKIASGNENCVAVTIGHDYVDGVCSICGAEEPVSITAFDFLGANMALNNSLAMNFAFSGTHYEDWTGFYAEIVKEYADGREDVTVTVPYAQWERRGNNYVVTYNGVAAKEMADNFHITVYNAQGQAVSVTRTDSVRAYARRTLDNPNTTEAVKAVVVNMLNYGAAAQNYFTYGTDDLANSILTAQEQELAFANIEVTDSRIAGDNFGGSTLVLNSNIKLSMCFTGVTEGMTAKAVYTDAKGVPYTVDCALDSDGRVDIDALAVADYNCLVTVTVYNVDSTVFGSASDSVASYVARNNIDPEVTEELKALGDTLVKFAEAARSYFVG